MQEDKVPLMQLQKTVEVTYIKTKETTNKVPP